MMTTVGADGHAVVGAGRKRAGACRLLSLVRMKWVVRRLMDVSWGGVNKWATFVVCSVCRPHGVR